LAAAFPTQLAGSLGAVVLTGLFFGSCIASAQSFKRGGMEFNAVRSVTVPAGKPYTIVVSEFFHHGEIRADGKNVLVTAQNRPVPMRVLQLGPDDVCRLAFQTVPGQSEYDIFYGGDGSAEKPPPWTARDGLLLETRRFTACNLNEVASVREAFNKAEPIGADYVEGVFHSYNPLTLKNEAFMSHYSGFLDIRDPGAYGFLLSSQDCSFLLIDDALVASAPGYHGPAHHAARGSRHDIRLAVGLHKFDYYHAAAGTSAIMVLAWEYNPVGDKPQHPAAIPPGVFHAHNVAHLPASRLSLRVAKQAPDFVVKFTNDVPLPDNDVPLIGALFRDNSVKALTMQGAKLKWDFGDGQTSELPNVDHVYLRPGLYSVKLSVRRGARAVEITNRIYVDRPHPAPKETLYSFDDYRKIIEDYDPKTLEAPALRQMVLVLEAKALALANQAEDAAQKAKAVEEDVNRRRTTRKERTALTKASRDPALVESDQYLAKAVAAGKVAFVDESAATGDEDLLKLAQLIGPMARLRLGDAETAFLIWQGAARRISTLEAKVESAVAAADIAVNDLLKNAEAKNLLDAATKQFGKNRIGPAAAMLERVRGDWLAATGDGQAARNAYQEAEKIGGFARPLVETTATRGAHARSTEEFLKEKEFARAAEELDAWQAEFPTEKIEGYWSLLRARYWAGRGKEPQAVAQAEQLLTVNRYSPYADQVLMVAADSEMRRGRKDRAVATLHSLIKDYPGSPLVEVAKRNLKALGGSP
jgi:PKD repeat protein/predicted negative regulator of RcsB-dependent stress response